MADREAQFRADMAAMRESLGGDAAEAQAKLEDRLREELAAAIARAEQEAAAARAKHAEVRGHLQIVRRSQCSKEQRPVIEHFRMSFMPAFL